MQITPEILQKLQQLLGEQFVFTDLDTRNHYGHDETEDYVFPPSVVLKPKSPE
ncbi:MAG: hypothetical protein RL494_685, partial [Bacteroidota bacterium]